jgi:hypothetical protein
MMALNLFVGFLTFFLFPSVHGNVCTDNCDATHTTGLPITFCGIDGVTYNTTYDGANSGHCYVATCYVTALHQGSCGCPNDCFEEFGHGTCSSGQCKCESGWNGQDCSLPTQGNPCGYHGKLITSDGKDSKFPFDYCDCDSGWTGTDCTSQQLTVGNAPWGTIFDEVTPYSKEDEYGDDHPIFDIAKLPTIRIQLKDEDFSSLIAPENLYSGEYVSADFFWDNGKDQKILKQVGMKIKGQASIESLKKGFTVKFNEYVSGQKLYDMKKLGLKPGFSKTDVFVKNLMYYNLMRASGGPAQREGYALLYINDFYYGLTILAEDIDDLFISRRLQDDDGSGSYFKMHSRVSLGYFGDNITYYRTIAKPSDMGPALNYYNAAVDTDEVWYDLVDFLYYFNITSGEKFVQEAESYLNIPALLRNMPVESFLLGSDNLQSRNNYYLYHYHNKDAVQEGKKQPWLIFYYDFDDSFSYCPYESDITCEESDIFKFYSQDEYIGDPSHFNPVLNGTFQSSKYVDQYVANYKQMLDTVFGSDSKQQPKDRCSQLANFVMPWWAKDRMYEISSGVTIETIYQDVAYTQQHLTSRYQNVMKQIADYEQSKRK